MRAIICEDVGGPNRRCIPIVSRTPECDPRCPEHQQPSNYVDALEWQEFMATTHVQRQCPGCGLWTIWEPKGTEENPMDNASDIAETCGDCIDGRCHWGGTQADTAAAAAEAGREYIDPVTGSACGCDRHAASVRARAHSA